MIFRTILQKGSVMLVLAGLILACSQELTNVPSPDNLVIYPAPPARTRLQYLTRFSTSDDLTPDKGRFHRYLFGEEKPLGILKPYGVKVIKDKIYICDTGLGGLVQLDLAEQAFERFVPGGKGSLLLPVNCCLDDNGFLYVADAGRNQIVVFDRGKRYVHAFGETENFRPTDVEFHQGKIYVANALGHSVLVYNPGDFELSASMAEFESGNQGFIRKATNISVRDSLLYVSDFGDFNVKLYTLNGEFKGVIGEYGNGPGQFIRPKGIALDREGTLYVADAAFDNVQMFNGAGDLLMYFGGSYEGLGGMWLPAGVDVSYENLSYFEPYVDEQFRLEYLVFVTNQYGPAKLNVYGFVEEKQ
jgi:DNA-binding beta-propeller fold protein YncE